MDKKINSIFVISAFFWRVLQRVLWGLLGGGGGGGRPLMLESNSVVQILTDSGVVLTSANLIGRFNETTRQIVS